MSFSFGGPFGALPVDGDSTPAVRHGPQQDGHFDHEPLPAKLLDLQLSPVAPDSGQALSFNVNAKPDGSVAASPAVSFSFNKAAASPAFSFGPQLGHLPAGSATPTAPFGPGAGQGGVRPKAAEAEAAQSAVRHPARHRRQGSSPALSLGVWGAMPKNAGASAAAGRTPSEFGFTFGNGSASPVATPVWPGMTAGAATAELAAVGPEGDFVRNIGAALDQFAVATSPTLFGMAAEGSPQDTPGVMQRVSAADAAASPQADACVPATAILWTALLAGALTSPMPAAVHARAQRRPWPTHPQAPSSAAAPESFRETNPAAGSTNVPSSLGSVAGRAAAPARVPATAMEVTTVTQAPSAASGSRAEAPPPYEDLPDLIARGLCLSASTPHQSETDPAAAGAVINTCSSIGENPTPFVCRTKAIDALPSAIDAGQQLSGAGFPPDMLFQPARVLAAAVSFALDDSPPALDQAPAEVDQLVVESVCGSSMCDSAYAGEQACSTAEPFPTPSRLEGPEPASACSVIPQVDSVHSSPVFSFHVASEDTTSPGSPVPVACTAATASAATTLQPVHSAQEAIPGIGCDSTIASRRDSSPGATDRMQPEDSPAFSADAVPRLLFDASTASNPTLAEIPPAAAVPTLSSPSKAAAVTGEPKTANPAYQDFGVAPPQAAAKKSLSALAPRACSDAGPQQATSAASMMSPTPSNGRPYEGPASPLTFSYLGNGTPPSTPPTAELASTGKGGPLFGHQPRASPRSSGGGGQFWAPSPSGPSAASSDRVTLEACNRRIRANADLLLDFQGSPGHITPTVPADSVTGAVTPRMKGSGPSASRPSALNLSPAGKKWEMALSPRNQFLSASTQVPLATGTADAAKPAVIAPKDRPAPAPGADLTAAPRFGSGAHAVSGALAPAAAFEIPLRPGALAQGPRLQQLVATGIEQALASATATVAQHGSMPMAHMPISQRLGLWPVPAWGVPVPISTGLPVSAAPAASVKPEPAQQYAVNQRPTAPAKPVCTSRDVQTTPGLVKSQFEFEDKVLHAAANVSCASAPPAPQPVPMLGVLDQAPGGGANGNRRPAYRSRIPVPGGISAPAPPAPVTSVHALPAPAAANGGGGISIAAGSDDDEQDGEAVAAAERLVRRRRLLSGTHGGPQRVLVKRGTQQHSLAEEAVEVATLGDEEMRRRAQILGMRISPYLRTKPSKARVPEAPKGSKG